MNAKKKYNVDTAWFEARLRDLGISKRELARRMHLDIRSLWVRLAGQSEIRAAEAKQLADILEVSFHEVMRRAGLEVEESRVPVRGHVNGDGVVHMHPGAPSSWIAGPVGLPSQTFGLACKTSGGSFSALSGAVVLAAESPRVEPDAIERLSLAKPESGPARLCVPRRGDRLGTYDLDDMCGNRLATGTRLAWAAPVLWIQT